MASETKAEEAGSWAQRLDTFQRRHRWAGLPLAVIYKFVDDQGAYQATLLTSTDSSRCSRCCCSR
jgi:hypothetical protein